LTTVGTNRLESFSDGVIAVAITLLVLGLHVPSPGAKPHHSLIYALANNWPAYAAYITSFVTIGIIWINHHVMINRLTEVDRPILILNLLLLMTIGALPFATDLMATYLQHPDGRSVAAAVYAATFEGMSIMFTALNRHIVLRKGGLLRTQLSASEQHRVLWRTSIGLIPYLVAGPLAFVSPYITLLICGAVAVYYALPSAVGPDAVASEP
jgi:uncharacterized membrane protein